MSELQHSFSQITAVSSLQRRQWLLAALASAGEGAALLVGMLLWVVALVGWALSLASVRRSLAGLRQGLRAWQRSRRQAAEDERTWQLALQDARMMADLSRAMSAQAGR